MFQQNNPQWNKIVHSIIINYAVCRNKQKILNYNINNKKTLIRWLLEH